SSTDRLLLIDETELHLHFAALQWHCDWTIEMHRAPRLYRTSKALVAAGLGGLVGTALAFPAQAQQALVLDEITVTATRAARPIEQVPT
ncbi:hypothetical protein, partial [Citrobacter koseri]|uniref:hypothetical protein n=1 Tax=Citrobacter koseri TaxID=545 RepID=UPI001953257F